MIKPKIMFQGWKNTIDIGNLITKYDSWIWYFYRMLMECVGHSAQQMSQVHIQCVEVMEERTAVAAFFSWQSAMVTEWRWFIKEDAEVLFKSFCSNFFKLGLLEQGRCSHKEESSFGCLWKILKGTLNGEPEPWLLGIVWLIWLHFLSNFFFLLP